MTDEVDPNSYVSTAKALKVFNISRSTLYRWDAKGKIHVIRTPSGVRKFSVKDIRNIIHGDSPPPEKTKIAYARVSSRKQVDDLERQKEFLQLQFPDHLIVSDIGSGINWKRKGLRTILEQTMQGKVSEVVVSHRDRLSRFAFELLEFILASNGTKLIVLDKEENKSPESELTSDIISILHVYSCRSNGKRRYSFKNKENKNLPDQGTEEAVFKLDGGREVCLQRCTSDEAE